ncbi:hypothetical protein EBZ39_04540 [bacterium]|nr:hypothetical protein [bacterium]
MSNKENGLVITGEVVHAGEISPEVGDLTPALQKVVAQIDRLFSDAQNTSIQAVWNIGKLITEVQGDPDKYLTTEQQSAHIDGEALIMSIFAPVYSVEQLRNSVMFFERYPSEHEVRRLLELRCPERPRWRLTATHVQLLAQIPDDTQRAAIEEKCAEEAYTAKTLAGELQEIRGKKRPGAGRTHEAPKGLKQQVADLLQHQRRFISRSDQLWLNEESDNIYDDIANASPTKIDETVRGYLKEVEENFDRLSDIIADHRAMCRKIREEIIDKLDDEEEETDDTDTSRKSRSQITR